MTVQTVEIVFKVNASALLVGEITTVPSQFASMTARTMDYASRASVSARLDSQVLIALSFRALTPAQAMVIVLMESATATLATCLENLKTVPRSLVTLALRVNVLTEFAFADQDGEVALAATELVQTIAQLMADAKLMALVFATLVGPRTIVVQKSAQQHLMALVLRRFALPTDFAMKNQFAFAIVVGLESIVEKNFVQAIAQIMVFVPRGSASAQLATLGKTVGIWLA